MRVVTLVVALSLAGSTSQSFADTTYPCFTHRGRLSQGNGPRVIWLVGTKRIVAVEDALPPPLEKLIAPYLTITSDEQSQIYGSFELCPVGPDSPGHRRYVRVKSAEQLVAVNVRGLRPPKKLTSTWPPTPKKRDP